MRAFIQKRRPAVFSALCVWALLTHPLAARDLNAAYPDRPPNIVLIMADDIGVECFGSYGGQSYSTPKLDALAQGGLRFTHCFSQPLCTPTRVQLMTGRSNIRNYVRFGYMPPGERTFGHIFRDAGYATAVAGKWQLHGFGQPEPFAGKGMHPRDSGFDEYCLWQIDRRESRYWSPVIEQNGRLLETAGRYGPDIFCDFITDFTTRHRDKPFLVYYPMVLTHSPFVPVPGEGERKPDGPSNPRHFAGMVRHMDAVVGRIVDRLDQLGLRENTVVIFTSDNGTQGDVVSHFNGRDVRGGKGKTTNAGTHVPLIVSWPGRVAPGVRNDLIDSTDFLPTLAELAGIRLPESPKLDGWSFAPGIMGRPHQPRPWLFSYYNPLMGNGRERDVRFTRDHRWKLYGTGEFYNVKRDPLEQEPIALEIAGPRAQEAHAKLKAALESMPATRTTGSHTP